MHALFVQRGAYLGLPSAWLLARQPVAVLQSNSCPSAEPKLTFSSTVLPPAVDMATAAGERASAAAEAVAITAAAQQVGMTGVHCWGSSSPWAVLFQQATSTGVAEVGTEACLAECPCLAPDTGRPGHHDGHLCRRQGSRPRAQHGRRRRHSWRQGGKRRCAAGQSLAIAAHFLMCVSLLRHSPLHGQQSQLGGEHAGGTVCLLALLT